MCYIINIPSSWLNFYKYYFAKTTKIMHISINSNNDKKLKRKNYYLMLCTNMHKYYMHISKIDLFGI